MASMNRFEPETPLTAPDGNSAHLGLAMANFWTNQTTAGPQGCVRHASSAKGENVSTHALVEELDFEGAISNSG